MPLALVTGGAGFIGSHVVDKLLIQGFTVRVLDDLSSGYKENLCLKNEHLKFVYGSIEDKSIVKDVCKNVELVIHLAAMVSVPGFVENPDRSAEINVAGFLNVMNTLRRQSFSGRFIYASSSAVYGDLNVEKPIKEKLAPGHLLSPYAIDKYTNELYAALYTELYGLNACGFRFFNVYGPRQDPSSSYSGVISIFIDRVQKNQSLGIYGDGQQTRDFVYVEDVAEILCSQHDNKTRSVFNIGTGREISIQKLAETVRTICNADVPINFLPARKGDIDYSCADLILLKEAIGFTPKVELIEGLQKLKAWSDL